MQIIPVLDILRGRVVRAQRGERTRYRPIESPLCGSADPCVVADRLSAHCATDALYVADLDALQGGGMQVERLAALLRGRPARRLWLDAGYRDADDLCTLQRALQAHGLDPGRVTPVLASEALPSAAALQRCRAVAPLAWLSLDRRRGEALDPAGLWEQPALWPPRLIVMTLDRVGSGAGPDLAALAAVHERAPGARLFGAGGVRHPADVEAAAAAGAAGWLVASALHDGGLPATGADRRSATQCRVAADAHPHSVPPACGATIAPSPAGAPG